MYPTKQALSGLPSHWASLLLPNGRTVLLIIRLEGVLQQLDPRVYFDDTSRADSHLGGQPVFGFQFLRLKRLETGTHRLSVFAGILDSSAVEDVRQAAKIFLSPPTVSVSLLKQ